MPSSYESFIARDAVQSLRSLPAAERTRALRFLDFLEQFPSTVGDTFEHDSLGRRIEVKVLGRVKIAYWPDHPVKEIKVLRVERH